MAITTETDQSLYVENIDYEILLESESDPPPSGSDTELILGISLGD